MDTLFHRWLCWLFRVSDRTYQLFLAAYPARFRRIYGKHMAQVYRDCCRDAYQQGGIGRVIVLWIVALYDLVTNASGEHITTLLHDMKEKSVLQAILSGDQEQARFMISSQQFPDVRLFRLLDCPCTARRIGGPLAL